MMPPRRHVCNGLTCPALWTSAKHGTPGQRTDHSESMIASIAHKSYRLMFTAHCIKLNELASRCNNNKVVNCNYILP